METETPLPDTRPAPRRDDRWRVQWGPTLRMVLLIGLGAMLVVKVATGHILLYVNGIYTRLILAAGISFIVLGYIAGLRWMVRRADTTHRDDHDDHGHATGRIEALGYAMLAIPLLLGLLVPAHPLGASAVASRTNATGSGPSVNSRLKAVSELDTASDRWTLLDWTAALAQTPNVRALVGKPVHLVGFVAQGDGGLGTGYFIVARFVIVCCVADGNAITLPVKWESPLKRDTWVQITGTLAAGTVDGKAAPYIAATAVESIPQPSQPYLYP
jgi:uncharacterized repeat protein (TIGR03943 family)